MVRNPGENRIMRGVIMRAPGDVRVEDRENPVIVEPTDAVIRISASCICGSDLSTIDGHSSRYFEPIVSFPFTPGHEVVGDLDDGTRAVLIPVLSCVTRGIDPVCPASVPEPPGSSWKPRP